MEHLVTAEQIISGAGFAPERPLDVIDRLSVILPTQGSITDFVHHNTLHAFQSLNFFDAIAEAAKIYGSTTRVQDYFVPQAGLLAEGLRRSRNARIRLDTEESVNSFIIRMSSAFFDQGVAATGMPYTNLGIWRSIQQLNRESFLSLGPISHRKSQKILQKSPEEALNVLLALLVEDKNLYPRFLAEVMLSLKGWAGLCHMAEHDTNIFER